MIKSCFPAVVNGDTRVLVLGSLPGEVSLSQGRYYAHPQNQFWRLMGGVIGADLPGLAYPQRLETLLLHGVGLWDVIGSARRRGSLDAAIREPQANALDEFAAALPSLRAIAFNGGKAAGIGRRRMSGSPDVALVDLPSSSPAYTASFAEKQARWLSLRAFMSPIG